MSDETPTNPIDNPFRSLGVKGIAGAIAALGLGMLRYIQRAREDTDEYKRNDATRQELDLFKKMREIERAEELHAKQLRLFDEGLRTQMDHQRAYAQDRMASEQKSEAYRAQAKAEDARARYHEANTLKLETP